jgi:hypothetical protein
MDITVRAGSSSRCCPSISAKLNASYIQILLHSDPLGGLEQITSSAALPIRIDLTLARRRSPDNISGT